jgi:hypothetical protein
VRVILQLLFKLPFRARRDGVRQAQSMIRLLVRLARADATVIDSAFYTLTPAALVFDTI